MATAQFSTEKFVQTLTTAVRGCVKFPLVSSLNFFDVVHEECLGRKIKHGPVTDGILMAGAELAKSVPGLIGFGLSPQEGVQMMVLSNLMMNGVLGLVYFSGGKLPKRPSGDDGRHNAVVKNRPASPGFK